MTQQQALDELNGLFVTARSITPSPWESYGSGVTPCLLASGKTGLAYEIYSMAPGLPRDQQPNVVQQIKAKFESLKLKPVQSVIVGDGIRSVTKIRSTDTSNAERIPYVEFEISTTVASFQGHSRCVAGNPYQTNAVWLTTKPAPTAAQLAYDELGALLELIATLVPGRWQDVGSEVRSCVLPSGAQGLFYVTDSIGPAAATDKKLGLIETINGAFTRAGISTMQREVASSSSDLPITQLRSTPTTSPDHIPYVNVSLAKTTTTFEGYSRCIAGNPYGSNGPWDLAHPKVAPE